MRQKNRDVVIQQILKIRKILKNKKIKNTKEKTKTKKYCTDRYTDKKTFKQKSVSYPAKH